MTVLAIDYGAKKIGLAKSADGEKLALPLEVLVGKNRQEILEHFNQLIATERISKIVIGVPVSLPKQNEHTFWRRQDLQNQQVREVLDFVQWVKDHFKLPVEIEDERMSTKMANTLNKGLISGGHDDAVAAMLILQSYLDRAKNEQ
ncbi:MAG: Holliday junction resolvase RuvX [Patescibacteria group bacterium]|nr:Holliday junction resolvase RuvX [Patescibacteria group bacterium]